jgi:hypothetical protein
MMTQMLEQDPFEKRDDLIILLIPKNKESPVFGLADTRWSNRPLPQRNISTDLTQ